MFLNAIYYMCHVCSVIQGDANAINYTGIVRGGTQKLIKQEIMNDQNDELLKSPDSILEELSYDSNAGKSSLVSIKSEKYQDYIKKMKLEWQEVKEEIKNSSLKECTKQNHLSTLRLLQEFKKDIHFADLTFEFISSFDNFLQSKGYHINTIAKHMKHVKRYVNVAINKEYMDY